MAGAEEQQVVANGNGVVSDDEDLSKMRPVDIGQMYGNCCDVKGWKLS